MGELTTEDEFTSRYAQAYGRLPLSYYFHTNIAHDNKAPRIDELKSFLQSGQILDASPWKKVTYEISDDIQEGISELFQSLFAEFDHKVSLRRRGKRTIGSKFEVFGTYSDDRGRAILEGILDIEGQVKKVNCVRRNVNRNCQEYPDDEILQHKVARSYLEETT